MAARAGRHWDTHYRALGTDGHQTAHQQYALEVVGAVGNRPPVTWVPAQMGLARFVFTARDPLGLTATRELLVAANNPVVNLAPIITSVAPTQGFAHRAFLYDVDAFEPEGEPVTFALGAAPQGMSIHPTTGLISWSPTAGGSFAVEVIAQDPGGAVGTQLFTVEVWADETAPLVIVHSTPRYPAVGETVRVSVSVQDEGPTPTVEVLLNGQPVVLDSESGFTPALPSPAVRRSSLRRPTHPETRARRSLPSACPLTERPRCGPRWQSTTLSTTKW